MENLLFLLNFVACAKSSTIQEKIAMKVLYYAYLHIKERRKKVKPIIVVIEREEDWEEVLINQDPASDKFAGFVRSATSCRSKASFGSN